MIGNTRSFSPVAKPVTGSIALGRSPWIVIAAAEKYDLSSWRIV
jgi:hypothetical protein